MSEPVKAGIFSGVVVIAIASGTLFAARQLSSMSHPPIAGVQRGFRGTGLVQIYNPRALAEQNVKAQIPDILDAASADGPKASEVFQNVRVLGNLSAGQFTRLMASMVTWVAPEQGCAFCHNTDNMALDTKYQKVVARRMLQMTQNINGNWSAHVHATGVTCYTCHGGNNVPANIWYNNPGPAAKGLAETQTGMGHPTQVVNWSSLPYDPFTSFLEQGKDIRVQGATPLRSTNLSSMKQTEWTYSLMMVMSQSLGVNCDYCHNTRAFRDWAQSTPARQTAWYGIRMVRDVNTNYLDPLNPVFPDYRKGPLGDSPKVFCATCHQGIYKPLFGVSMLTTFKTELGGPPATTAALMAPYNPPPDAPANDAPPPAASAPTEPPK